MVKKQGSYLVEGLSLGQEGQGVARIEGMAVFVPGLLPYEKAWVEIVKKKKRYAIGRLLSIEEESAQRVAPPCPYFGRCGGCDLQHLSYSGQLKEKRIRVEEALGRIGHIEDPDVLDVVASRRPFRFRSKLTFQVRGGRLGFFERASRRFVRVKDCLLIPEDMAALMAPLEALIADLGLSVERLVIKRSVLEQGMLVVFYGPLPSHSTLKALSQAATGLSSVLGLGWLSTKDGGYMHLGGQPYLKEEILGFSFHLSPLAFVQINHPMMESMYAFLLHALNLGPDDVVADLYCGMGSITCHLAKHAGRVVGVDEVKAAIGDARVNARLNHLDNTEFIQGRVEELLLGLRSRSFDVVVLDPPRAGLDPRVVEELICQAPRTLAYISCDPATLARDLALFLGSGLYHLRLVQPFDMFSQSMHVETVVLMSRVDK